MTAPETYSLAFDLIRRYAVREGWIPIGFRHWSVGPWRITVNGTSSDREGIPPYHALVEHREVVAFLLLNPVHGSVGGWQHAERDFIHAMTAELTGAADDRP